MVARPTPQRFAASLADQRGRPESSVVVTLVILPPVCPATLADTLTGN
jgi:hypothetical protein